MKTTSGFPDDVSFSTEDADRDLTILILMEQYDSWLWLQVHKAAHRDLRQAIPGEVLDLEVDEITQRTRIKLWKMLQRQKISNIRGYIKLIIRTEIIDFLRRQRYQSTLSLLTDEEGEPYTSSQLFQDPTECQDPADAFERMETLSERTQSVLEAILALPPRQQYAMLASLKAHGDDALPLIRALQQHGITVEAIPDPEDQLARQRLHGSLSVARKRLKALCYPITEPVRANQQSIPESTRDDIPTEVPPSQEMPNRGEKQWMTTKRSPSTSVTEKTLRSMHAGELLQWVPLLREPYQTIMRLHDIQGLSYRQIAAQLRLPLGTVKSQVNRGRELFQQLTHTPTSLSISSSTQTDLAEQLRMVPRPYRTILTLHYLQGLSYPQLAAHLQLPLGTVKSHISRGRKLLLLAGYSLPTVPRQVGVAL